MTAGDVLSLIAMLGGFFLILFLAYWATKVLARGYAAGGTGHMIEVLDRMGLGQEKQLLVVKAAGKVLLLGVTAHHIEKLEELDAGELPEAPPSPQSGAFFAALKSALEQKKGKESGDEPNAGAGET